MASFYPYLYEASLVSHWSRRRRVLTLARSDRSSRNPPRPAARSPGRTGRYKVRSWNSIQSEQFSVVDADRPETWLATRLAFLVAAFGACWAPLVPFAKHRLQGLLLLCLGGGDAPCRRH